MMRKWRVKLEREYGGRAVEVKLARRFTFETITVRTVVVAGDDFDQKLAEAISEARLKAITLNESGKHAARKLPA